MRSNTLLLQALAAAGTFAVPVFQEAQSGPPPADMTVKVSGMSREQQGHIIRPGGLAPEVQELKPLYADYYPGLKRKKIRYGKYNLPAVNAWTAMSMLTGEAGTMTNIAPAMKKPCDECGLVLMQAGLEYADGTVANTDTGAWLHHIVLVLTGGNRQDSMCMITPGQRFFSSGNERLIIPYTDFEHKKVNSVYPIKKTDTISMQLELMNLKEQPKEVYITLDYEYLENDKIPKDWKETRAVWLDITGCGISSTGAPRGKMAFTMQSTTWRSQWDGQMISVGGHVHDGGINVVTYQNKKQICDSQATYSKPAGKGDMADMPMKRDAAHMNEDMPHIENMSYCSMMGKFSKGDQFYLDANYDFNKHMGMKANSGNWAEIMGIAILYVAIDRTY